jgi:hypothetical protein
MLGYDHHEHSSLDAVRAASLAYNMGTYSPPTEYRIEPGIPPRYDEITPPAPEDVHWPSASEQETPARPSSVFSTPGPLNTQASTFNPRDQASSEHPDPPPPYDRESAPPPSSPGSPSPAPAAVSPSPISSTPASPVSRAASGSGSPHLHTESPSPSGDFSIEDMSFSLGSDISHTSHDAGSQFSDFTDVFTQTRASNFGAPSERAADSLDFDSLCNALREEANIADDGNQGTDLSVDLEGLQLGDEVGNPESPPPRTPSRSTTPTNAEADADDEDRVAFGGTISPEPSPSRIRHALVPECLSPEQEDFLHLYHEVPWDTIFAFTRKLHKNILIGRDVEAVRNDFLYIFARHGMNDAQAKLFGRWVFGPEPLGNRYK